MELKLIGRKGRWTSTFKFIIGKFRYEGKETTLEDLNLLVNLAEAIVREADRNRDWDRRAWVVSHLVPFIRNLRVGRDFEENAKAWISYDRDFIDWIPSPHGYFGMKTCGVEFTKLKRLKKREHRRPPPKRFVGVGYKDKGARRDKAKDASPSWQEVAVSESDSRGMQRKRPYTVWLTEATIELGIGDSLGTTVLL